MRSNMAPEERKSKGLEVQLNTMFWWEVELRPRQGWEVLRGLGVDEVV